MAASTTCPRCGGRLQWDMVEFEYRCIQCGRPWFLCPRCRSLHTSGQPCQYTDADRDQVERVTPPPATGRHYRHRGTKDG